LQDQIQLERKESMKARGLASPDTADALAVTFAVTVPIPEAQHELGAEWGKHEREKVLDYDPVQARNNHSNNWLPR
jgi:hypothetical protein